MAKTRAHVVSTRMNVPRGPCSVPVLRECWVHGVIDQNTLIWGQGLMDWLPVRNVRTLVPQIRTIEGMGEDAVGHCCCVLEQTATC